MYSRCSRAASACRTGCADEPAQRGDDLGVLLLLQVPDQLVRDPLADPQVQLQLGPGAGQVEPQRERRPATQPQARHSHPDHPGRRDVARRPGARRTRARMRDRQRPGRRELLELQRRLGVRHRLAVELERGQVAELGAGQQLVEVRLGLDRPAAGAGVQQPVLQRLAVGERSPTGPAAGSAGAAGRRCTSCTGSVGRVARGYMIQMPRAPSASGSTRSARSTWSGKCRMAAAVNASCTAASSSSSFSSDAGGSANTSRMVSSVGGDQRLGAEAAVLRALGLQAEQPQPGVGDVAWTAAWPPARRPCP